MLDQSTVDNMHGWEAEGERFSAHSGLFISLLLRYPQLGSVKYVPSSACLVMEFVLRHVLMPHEFAKLQLYIQHSLELYSELTGHAVHVLNVERIDFEPFCTLKVTRDVATLTPDELSLIVGILSAEYGEHLVFEGVEAVEPGAVHIQDDMIEHMLDDVRQIPFHRDLIGFREGGRVLLFKRSEHK